MNPYDHDEDPDDPEFIEILRDSGLDDEQIEQSQQALRYLRDLTPEQREAHEQQSNDISMGLSLSPRVANTRELIAIAALAEGRDYNRQLKTDTIRRLDPFGFHILRPVLIHRHAQGEDVAAHMRCHGHLKLVDRDVEEGAYETTVDVPMELFVELVEVPDDDWQEKLLDEIWRVILRG